LYFCEAGAGLVVVVVVLFPTGLSFTTVLGLVPRAFFLASYHFFLSFRVAFLGAFLWFCASPLQNYVPTFFVLFFRHKSVPRLLLLVVVLMFLFRVFSFPSCRVRISNFPSFNDSIYAHVSKVYLFFLDRSHSS